MIGSRSWQDPPMAARASDLIARPAASPIGCDLAADISMGGAE